MACSIHVRNIKASGESASIEPFAFQNGLHPCFSNLLTTEQLSWNGVYNSSGLFFYAQASLSAIKASMD